MWLPVPSGVSISQRSHLRGRMSQCHTVTAVSYCRDHGFECLCILVEVSRFPSVTLGKGEVAVVLLHVHFYVLSEFSSHRPVKPRVVIDAKIFFLISAVYLQSTQHNTRIK
jgi:hypothetical protein